MVRRNGVKMNFIKKGDNFSKIIKESHNKDVFVQFSATWCGPCKVYTENVKKVESQYDNRYSFFKIDIDDHPSLVKQYQIRGVPKTVIISKGSIKNEFTGVKTVSDLNKLLG